SATRVESTYCRLHTRLWRTRGGAGNTDLPLARPEGMADLDMLRCQADDATRKLGWRLAIHAASLRSVEALRPGHPALERKVGVHRHPRLPALDDVARGGSISPEHVDRHQRKLLGRLDVRKLGLGDPVGG